MAFTARLKPELEAEARLLADRMGISLMALVSVARSEYVSARRTQPSGPPSPVQAEPPAPPSPAPAPAPVSQAPSLGSKDRTRHGPKPPPPPKVKHRSGAALMERTPGMWGTHTVTSLPGRSEGESDGSESA